MLAPGPCKRVTIHLNADTSSEHDFLFRDILTFLLEQGVAGATLIRPEAGFGSHHTLHNQQADGVAGLHLPVRIEFLESAEKLAEILPELFQMVDDGVIEVHDTTILKVAVS
jgi:PII-like signaling protein